MNIRLTDNQTAILNRMAASDDDSTPPFYADPTDLQVLAAKGLVDPIKLNGSVGYKINDLGRCLLREQAQ